MNECCSITLTLLDARGVEGSGTPQLLSQSKQWLFDRQLRNWEPCLVVDVMEGSFVGWICFKQQPSSHRIFGHEALQILKRAICVGAPEQPRA
jgi:hypothetical protein